MSISAIVSDEINPVFTAYSEGDLTLEVTTADMLNTSANSNNNSIADSASENLYVSLIAGGGKDATSVSCTYDLFWKQSGTAYTPSPNAASAGLMEYTIKVLDENGFNIVVETSVQLLQSRASNNQTIIASGLSISSSGVLTTKIYSVIATIYNLNVVQNIYNKTYSSIVGVTNVTC